MSIYIAPFTYNSNNLVLPLNKSGLHVVAYKSDKGPTGFNIDELSRKILIALIINASWYSFKKNEFIILTNTKLDTTIYDLTGIILIEEVEFTNDVFIAREVLKIIQKNKLLARYSKPLLDVPDSIFLKSCSNNLCNKVYCELILKGRNACLWNWSDIGGHLLFDNFDNSLIMKKINTICQIYQQDIIYCDNINKMPLW
jgi:hypothetical protein